MRPRKPRIDIAELAAKRTRCKQAKARGESCQEFVAVQRAASVVVPPPPPLTLDVRSPRAIVTVVHGPEAEKLFRVSGPYMRSYAERLGADLVVCDWPGAEDWPMSAKFQAARALDHYERIAYVDADVLLRPGCVDLFAMCADDEFGACDEFVWHQTRPKYGREHAYIAFRRKYQFRHLVNLPLYFNLGVYVAGKQHQPYLLPPTGPLPATHCAEQDWCNSRLLDAYLAGDVKVRLLDRRANWQNWTDPLHRCATPDAILHWSGATGERRSRAELMRVASAASPLDHPWEIDARHRDWLRSVLMSGKYRRVLEIGSHKGYSTQAFIDALQAGVVSEVHLCDPVITPEVEAFGTIPGVTLHRCASVDLLARERFDLVFVDGDHRLPNMQEETRLLLEAQTPAVFAHDTRSSEWHYTDCEGPPYLREAFLAAGYKGTEDAEWRQGERTERGMFFAER